jgi:hypothetical protein
VWLFSDHLKAKSSSDESLEGLKRALIVRHVFKKHPRHNVKLTVAIVIVRTDFFDDIFVPFTELPDEAE